MKITITIQPKYAHRLQVHVPVKASYWVEQIQGIKHVHHHKEGNYSMMYFPNTIHYLKKMFGDALSIEFDEAEYPPRVFEKKVDKNNVIKEVILPKYARAIEELEQWIRLKQYSPATLKSYKHCFTKFLWYFNDKDPKYYTKNNFRIFTLPEIH